LNANKLRQSIPDIVKYLYNKKSVDDKEWVCRTCHNHLIKNRVPPCAIAYGMIFPEKPDFFDLNELECRLLAPRIAFQKLMQAPRGRQLKIYGNIVNVPADVTNTFSMLPRRLSQTGTIKVNLKRKLQYKSSAMSLNVRPYKVVQAANWLMINSSLYRNEGILLNNDWVSEYNEEIKHQNENGICDKQLCTETCNENNIISLKTDNGNECSEDEAEVPAGVTDTMLTATDFLEDNERQYS